MSTGKYAVWFFLYWAAVALIFCIVPAYQKYQASDPPPRRLQEMIKKGEITVEQGKTLNEELKHNLDQKLHQRDQKDAGADVSSILKNLSEDDLKELKKRLAEVDADDKQQDENL